MNSISLGNWKRSAAGLAAALAILTPLGVAQAQTVLNDQPLTTSLTVPGNVLLALSVEYPTASSIANSAKYSSSTAYDGYFSPTTCYVYVYPTSTTTSYPETTTAYYADTDQGANASQSPYFYPYSATSSSHTCTSTAAVGLWSGNFLNWATMQTIDNFRWALTGGYRVIDLPFTNTTYMTPVSSVAGQSFPNTILEKAWASGQGGASETPNRIIEAATGDLNNPNNLQASIVDPTTVTPLPWNGLQLRVWGLGDRLQFINGNTTNPPVAGYVPPTFDGNSGSTADTPYTNQPSASLSSTTIYSVKIRIAACVPASYSAGLLENNCTPYGSSYKPEGLMQKYNLSMNFGAMGYMNDSNILRDAGVLRAEMGPIGPYMFNSTGGSPLVNPAAEWSATTGVFNQFPDQYASADSIACPSNYPNCITASGVINYLNNFGYAAKTYKTYDPVSELYYAAQRYFRGPDNGNDNEPSWTSLTLGNPSQATINTWMDGFPVFPHWYTTGNSTPLPDPIQYGCQQNFIMGIGDVNTHASSNVSGPISGAPSAITQQWNSGGFAVTSEPQRSSGNEPALPASVAADTSIDAVAATNFVGNAEGIGNIGQVDISWCCGDDATYLMAGLAYQAHVNDIRPNDFLVNGTKTQISTITTYWLDVEEYQTFHYQNQFWLAAKYGGFPVPPQYTPYVLPTTQLPVPAPSTPTPNLGAWATGANCTETTGTNAIAGCTGPGDAQAGGSGKDMPNNYLPAGNAALMVKGLVTAFQSIASSVAFSTNPLAVASPLFSASGGASYGSSYNPKYWTGDVNGYITTFDAQGNPASSQQWDEDVLIAAQLGVSGTGTSTVYGWNTNRFIATWNGTQGVAFRLANIPTTAVTSFNAITGVNPLAEGTTAAQSYLNYLRGDQSNEGTPSSTFLGYRPRTSLLGDIVNSKLAVIGPPDNNFSNTYNSGYSTFVSTWANRPTMIYVGANDGMMHAFVGGTSAPPAGFEQFAYVPSALFAGPTGTPAVNGLASLGATPFAHHYLVDATPNVYDVDFGKTGGTSAGAPNWHSILIGGLGKGGKSFYAIDVTNPAAMTSETAVAANVLWEFTDPTMGYSYGSPSVAKTVKWGWVVALTSGYDNADGHGYVYFINPKTGVLLEKVAMPDTGSSTNQAGLAPGSFSTGNYQDLTADAYYGVDLLGDVWRISLSSTTASYQSQTVQFAKVTSGGNPQPITTDPLIIVNPQGDQRYVTFATGQWLASSDVTSGTLLTQQQSLYVIPDGTIGDLSAASTPVTTAQLPVLTTAELTQTPAPNLSSGFVYNFPSAIPAGRVNVDPQPLYTDVVFAVNYPEGSVCSPSGTNDTFAISVISGASQLVSTTGVPQPYVNIPGGAVTSLNIVCVSGNCEALPATPQGPARLPITPTAAGGLKRLNYREVPTAD